jgi:hypothetical protein
MRFRFLVVVDADTLRERRACMLPDDVLNLVSGTLRDEFELRQQDEEDLELQLVSIKQLEDE